MKAIYPLVVLVASASLIVAEPRKFINPDTINDKVRLKLDQEVSFRFKREGDKLVDPVVVKPTDSQPSHIKIHLGTTSEAPFPPPRKDATRPYLQLENQLEVPIQFRVLARNKGSKDFFEITHEFEPIRPGETGQMCWTFDSKIEEVVMYQFAVSAKPAK